MGHGFGDAVGEGEEDVAGVDGESGLVVGGAGEEADYCSGGFERNGGAVAEDVRGVVSGVDVGEEAGGGVVFGVEEGGVAVGGGGVVDEAIDLGDEGGERTLLQAGDAAEAGAEAGHEEGGGDAFAGDVAEGDGEARWGWA